MKKEDCYKTRNLKINWACPSPYSVTYSYFGHTYLMHSYKYSATRDQRRRWCRRISDELTFHQTPALHPAALLEADPRLTPAHAYSWCGWLITPCTARPAGVGRKPPPKAPATDKLRCFSWLLHFYESGILLISVDTQIQLLLLQATWLQPHWSAWVVMAAITQMTAWPKGYVMTRTPRHLPSYRSTLLLLFRIYLNIFNKTL